MGKRKYDKNYYLDRQKYFQDRQREYYEYMPPEMKEAYKIENRKRNAEWYRKKHPTAKPYEPRPEQQHPKQPKPIKEPKITEPTQPKPVYRVTNEIKLVYLRWD